ncbi:MAG: ABC transporter ATP-binding protein [Bifidobacterium sp.]|uniref:ABC transporter ATP-binding protein n=1 Tax=Bifidobacterium fermentum TaxID=3059035 RepID=A0AB39UHP4_9BIFI
MTDVVTVENLGKKFGRFQALRRVGFSVRTGETFGFIGPNGAGKSTTIRILLGMLKADEGRAEIFGQDAWNDAVDIHRRVAYVPGDVFLWPNLTGGEIIDTLLRLNGERHSSRTDDLIREFNLDATKKSRTYSKGNRQKVALVAAFSSNADLYVFDEPTSGLDPLMIGIFENHVLALKDAGKSVLLSSHILSEVERICDRIGIVRKGEIIEEGTLDEMRQFSRSIIRARTAQPLDRIGSLPFVSHFDAKSENEAVFSVDSDSIANLIAAIQPLGITSFESTPPTLEDLFMRYYNETPSDGPSSSDSRPAATESRNMESHDHAQR